MCACTTDIFTGTNSACSRLHSLQLDVRASELAKGSLLAVGIETARQNECASITVVAGCLQPVVAGALVYHSNCHYRILHPYSGRAVFIGGSPTSESCTSSPTSPCWSGRHGRKLAAMRSGADGCQYMAPPPPVSLPDASSIIHATRRSLAPGTARNVLNGCSP